MLLAVALVLAVGVQQVDAVRRRQSKVMVPFQYVVAYKTGVLPIKDATDRLHASVATALSAEPSALGAAAASPEVAAELARPFETLWTTPIERDVNGAPVPGATALVHFNERLAGGQTSAVDLSERIQELILANPEVEGVFPHFHTRLSAACGLVADAKCDVKSSTPCCRGTDATCGSGPLFCENTCMAYFGKCNTPTLERRNVLNQAKISAAIIPQMLMTEAAYADPATKKVLAPRAIYRQFSVMVIDSGVGPHDDIVIGKCQRFPSSVPDTTDCSDTVSSHGTMVAGVIGAKNNGQGAWGVLEGTTIFAASIKVDGDPSGLQTNTLGTLEALRSIIESNNEENVAVINMSLGLSLDLSKSSERGVRGLFCNTLTTLAQSYGIVVVAAAGNDGAAVNIGATGIVDFPGTCDTTLVVTAMKSCSAKVSAKTGLRCLPARFTNFLRLNASEDDRKRVVAGPGVDIYSTQKNNNYGIASGTSFAAPHVSGIVARCFATKDCILTSPGASNNPDQWLLNRNLLLEVFAARSEDPLFAWGTRQRLLPGPRSPPAEGRPACHP